MNWLKRNLYTVLLVAAVVALSLILVPLYTSINSIRYTESDAATTIIWLNIVNYGCIALAELSFIILGVRRNLEKPYLIFAIILFFVSSIALNVYRLVWYEDYVSIYYIVIDVAVMIFMILSLSNRSYFLTTLIILLVDASTSLLGTFTGSSIEFSKLIFDFMLLISVYFYSNYEQLNSDYNNYS